MNWMTNEHLRVQVEDLGFTLARSSDILIVKDENMHTVLFLLANKTYAINNTFEAFYKLSETRKGGLMAIVYQYLRTPLKYREGLK